MSNTTIGNYVKFIRINNYLWNTLEEKDKDTLYFVFEKTADNGKLYLGDKLISDGTIDFTFLNKLILPDRIRDGALLIYDKDRDSWYTSITYYDILNSFGPFVGATLEEDGLQGLVPEPLKTDIDNYLKGDGTWGNPVAGVQSQLNALLGDDVNTDNTIRDIAKDEATTEVAKVVAEAPESFDTLKEIADWIVEHEAVTDLTTLMERVDTIEKDYYGEGEDEAHIPGDKEKLAEALVTISELQNEVEYLKAHEVKWVDIEEEEVPELGE